MIVGTFSFLFGSVLGVLKIWAEDESSSRWISNILAGSFQAGL
jgi:hypothetical protein